MGSHKTVRSLFNYGSKASLVVIACLLMLGSLTALASRDRTHPPLAGFPFYPDLAAIPPDDLYFSPEVLDDGQSHVLLRFTTAVANIGEGPLELAGNPASEGEDVSQVIYDAPVGGERVRERYLAVDLIHHPAHHHFHLADFARYELYQVDQDERLIPTGIGGKQSSCVLDSVRVASAASQERTYTSCQVERQGMTVGWQDVYSASLPGQWVDLGSEPLPDGAYLLRYEVDPLAQVDEGERDDNNVAETAFTVRGGVIADRPEPPRCAIDGPTFGLAGQPVGLVCSHFERDAVVAVYWDTWDPWNDTIRPAATFVGNADTAVAATVMVPTDMAPGAHTISAVAYDREQRRHLLATVIYGVEPGEAGTPGIGTDD